MYKRQVFDVVGADVWEESLLSLKSGGRLVITGVTSGARTEMNLSILQGKPLHLMGSGSRSRKSFAEMMKVINQGSIHGIVSQVFPLESVADAHHTMEDRNFYDHSGLRFQSILRAVMINMLTFSKKQGASTITQQLARNMYNTIGFKKTKLRISELFLVRFFFVLNLQISTIINGK